MNCARPIENLVLLGYQTTCGSNGFWIRKARVSFSMVGGFGVARGLSGPSGVFGQIDPMQRELFQFGYNAPLQGHAPLAAYAFYYRNEPNFFRTNLTLRLALAPTYLDSELGISHVLDENTDLGIGLAGGGFADSYDEIREGQYLPEESFTGHGGEVSLSLYHCFNPDQKIPFDAVLRGSVHYSVYQRDDSTRSDFVLPDDRTSFYVRTGLRWGGKEPILFPSLAMELSIWYEGQFRAESGGYGFQTGNGFDRELRPVSHLIWGQALLAYTMTNSGQSFYINLTAGASASADRFSAYRLGALLPLVSEFPLSLPGYYYQEISAQKFVLLGGNYIVPIDARRRWNINFNATTAGVGYVDGLEQPGHWHSGIGAGILYQTRSIKVMLGYAYGIDAIRSGGRGAHSVGILMQLNLKHAKAELYSPDRPNRWRGLQRIFSGFGD